MTSTAPPDTPEPSLRDHVVAVVKESVSNALRHSQARTIDVRVACDGARMLINVADDGVGFDPAPSTAAWGCATSPGEWPHSEASTCSIRPPGKGTIVTVSKCGRADTRD